MKKLPKILFALTMCMATAFLFTSCNDDDAEDTNCYFEVALTSMEMHGMTDGEQVVWDYSSEIEAAYLRALGMAENSVMLQGDYSTLKSDMKKKFEAVVLPEAPETQVTYKFTYSLKGSHNGNMETIASKEFSN